MAHIFDANAYLEANPDVARAVADRAVASAWRHYAEIGFHQGREGVPEAVRERVAAVLGGGARLGSEGDPDRQGKLAALEVFVAASPRLAMDEPMRVLCAFEGACEANAFVPCVAPLAVVDVALEAAGAGGPGPRPGPAGRGARAFAPCSEDGRLPFPDAAFDLVFAGCGLEAGSLGRMHRRLAELRRVTRREGIAVLATGRVQACRCYFPILECRPGFPGMADFTVCQRPADLVV